MGTDRERLARLLAGRNEPSALEREAAFERVVAAVAPKRKRRLWPAAAALVAAAGALVLVALPKDEFSSRGEQKGSFRVHCVDAGAAVPCRPGAKMIVSVTAPAARPYFALFGARGDTSVWYRPEKDARSGRVATNGEVVLPDGYVLSNEAEGALDLYGVFSSQPLDRAAIRAAFDDPPDDIELVKRSLTPSAGGP